MGVAQRDDRGARGRLGVAVAELDDAFAPEPNVGLVDGCLRCFSEAELAMLGGDPASIPDELVRAFAEKVDDHWSPEQYGPLWRRLAPSIIRRLLSADPAADGGRLLRGLGVKAAGFADWPARQRSAIRTVLQAALDVALIDGRPPDQVLGLLGAVAHVDHDVTPWTDGVDTLIGPYADAGFVRLTNHWAFERYWGHDPHWSWYSDDPTALGHTWLRSASVQDRIGRFAAAHPLCKTAADALAVIDAMNRGVDLPRTHPLVTDDQARDSALSHLTDISQKPRRT